jgi:hypothetical protein
VGVARFDERIHGPELEQAVALDRWMQQIVGSRLEHPGSQGGTGLRGAQKDIGEPRELVFRHDRSEAAEGRPPARDDTVVGMTSIGRLFMMPPSTSSSLSRVDTGGNTPGMATEARSAMRSEPVE